MAAAALRVWHTERLMTAAQQGAAHPDLCLPACLPPSLARRPTLCRRWWSLCWTAWATSTPTRTACWSGAWRLGPGLVGGVHSRGCSLQQLRCRALESPSLPTSSAARPPPPCCRSCSLEQERLPPLLDLPSAKAFMRGAGTVEELMQAVQQVRGWPAGGERAQMQLRPSLGPVTRGGHTRCRCAPQLT